MAVAASPGTCINKTGAQRLHLLLVTALYEAWAMSHEPGVAEKRRAMQQTVTKIYPVASASNSC